MITVSDIENAANSRIVCAPTQFEAQSRRRGVRNLTDAVAPGR